MAKSRKYSRIRLIIEMSLGASVARTCVLSGWRSVPAFKEGVPPGGETVVPLVPSVIAVITQLLRSRPALLLGFHLSLFVTLTNRLGLGLSDLLG